MILSPALEAQQLLDDAIAVTAGELASGIAGIPYSVGNGVVPHPSACRAAADKLCQKFAGAILAAVEFERAVATIAELDWMPIADAPPGNDTDGPFFDIAWKGETTTDGTLRRCMDCYFDSGRNVVMMKSGHPAVWTVFRPQPTHFRLSPQGPA